MLSCWSSSDIFALRVALLKTEQLVTALAVVTVFGAWVPVPNETHSLGT